MTNKRAKPKVVTSAGELGQLQFNEPAYGTRNISVGGVYDILGSAATAVRVGLYSALMVANTDTVGHYVKIGASNVAAPSGLADGIFIPAGQCLFLSTGELGEFIIADDAAVGIYKMKDNIVVADDERQRN